MRPITSNGRRLTTWVVTSAAAAAVVAAAGPASRPAADGPSVLRPAGPAASAATPEAAALAERVGLWDVTKTVWPAPDAAPVTTTGLVADRRMVGSALQETIRPADDAAGRDPKRVDLLRFNPLSAQWEYLSLDTRVNVGLMPARSFTRADADGRVVLVHDPFVIPGDRPGAPPAVLQMDSVVSRQGPDHDVKEQHFVAADGTVWLAHRYAYARRP